MTATTPTASTGCTDASLSVSSTTRSAEKASLGEALSDAVTLLYTHGCLTGAQRNDARKRLVNVATGPTLERVSNRYKFADTCFACSSMPCDQPENPWAELPWVVHFNMAHYPKFVVDGRDPDNADMFLGYKISGDGRIARQSLTTGEGGRLAFHRAHFVEELPA